TERIRATLGEEATFTDAIEAVAQGSHACATILEDTGETVGRALAMVCNVVDPDAIVLGGDLALAGPVVADAVHTAVRRRAPPRTRRAPPRTCWATPHAPRRAWHAAPHAPRRHRAAPAASFRTRHAAPRRTRMPARPRTAPRHSRAARYVQLSAISGSPLHI